MTSLAELTQQMKLAERANDIEAIERLKVEARELGKLKTVTSLNLADISTFPNFENLSKGDYLRICEELRSTQQKLKVSKGELTLASQRAYHAERKISRLEKQIGK